VEHIVIRLANGLRGDARDRNSLSFLPFIGLRSGVVDDSQRVEILCFGNDLQ
jgi:hypothetical protein